MMRTLVVGAGATGGYFGARLAEAGADVTFLVRPGRAAALAARGLRVESPLGAFALPDPPTVTADRLAGPFDLVLVSCKAYDLDAAIVDLAPAVGEGTAILPLLNGLAHLDRLDARFGAARVLGGSCGIIATLTPDGAVRHMTEMASLTYGERDGARSARIAAVDALMRPAAAKFQPRPSDAVLLEMWEKWVFLATLAGATTLARAAVGDIVAAPGGLDLIAALHAECTGIAAASGHAPRPAVAERARAQLTAPGSTVTASMLRDIEGAGRIEADHVIGDLLARGRRLRPEAGTPELARVYAALKAYEARRAREAA